MKSIEIQAKPFFEMLKDSNKSMWEIFAHMIKEEEQEVLFMEGQRVLFSFKLPATIEELNTIKEAFDEQFRQKLKTLLN